LRIEGRFGFAFPCGTAYSTMDRKSLDNLREELARLRRSPQKATALEGLARRLGRKLSDRGKHPTWVSTSFPHLRPVSIPRHGGRDLPPGTRKNILDFLEEDLLAWEEGLQSEHEK
jgi:hypothetical protein